MDFLASLLVLGTAVVVLAGELGGKRRSLSRAARDRVGKQGTSPLLGRTVMEAVYRVLTPTGRWLGALGVTADQITWTSLALGAATGVALALGNLGIGALLSALSSLGDTLDGIVARESRTASDAGEVLDAAVDRYEEAFFLGGLSVLFRDSVPLLSLCLFTLLGSFMVSYATAKAEALSVEPPRGAMRRPERAAYLTIGVALAPVAAGISGPSGAPLLPPAVPVILALSVVGIAANVSAVRRLACIARLARGTSEAPAGAATVPEVPSRRPFLRHQVSSVVATAVDFGSMALLVERGRVDPALSTLAGATLGAVVNFLLNRHFAFVTRSEAIRREAARYAVTSAASAALNGAGMRVLAGWLGAPYLPARALVAVLVNVCWNFPMHRGFVFRHRVRNA